jgi:hypothetical protein
MSEILPFWLAMKHHSEGKSVQFRPKNHEDWCDFLGKNNMCSTCFEDEWRLKPEPVKYSVDIWTDKIPKSEDTHSIYGVTIGNDTNWETKKSNKFNTPVRITVEVLEQDV